MLGANLFDPMYDAVESRVLSSARRVSSDGAGAAGAGAAPGWGSWAGLSAREVVAGGAAARCFTWGGAVVAVTAVAPATSACYEKGRKGDES